VPMGWESRSKLGFPQSRTINPVTTMVVQHRVVLVCGLPGAGKSTLCRHIERLLEVEEEENDAADTAGARADADADAHPVVVRIIEYDQLMMMSSTTSTDDDVPDDDDDDVQPDKNHNQNNNNLAAWHAARTTALAQLQQQIRMMAEMDRDGLTILDDNFYLRSMRKDVCRVLQQYQYHYHHHHHDEHHPSVLVLFGIIWVDVPLQVCLARNAARDHRPVDSHVIRRMHERMQVPLGTSTYYWDQCTLRLEYGNNDDNDDDDDTQHGSGGSWTNTQMQSIKQFIQSGLQPIAFPPTMPPLAELPQQDHQQPVNNNNDNAKELRLLSLAQRRDAYWRCCVSTIGRQWPSLAQSANQARRQCLLSNTEDASRDDFLQLFLSLCTAAMDDNNNNNNNDDVTVVVAAAPMIRTALAALGDPPTE
jgi:tRNA uridine 5-carbamoylmethylation protein Kti12